ncbi:polysaccharide deacetylase family protein [candidate division KSB1 bacterium]|nr:polysaccharide deacetylase family protein [candidate division KSB1 bacterium]RQW01191.1 MAG: polysaccharide deacetylase family protein [candidate division KSB1 bacterium]
MTKQDLAVLLLYYLGFSRIRNSIFLLQRKPIALFLLFHDIPPNESACFETKMLFLKRIGNIISLDDFFSGKLAAEKINIVITFDDGFRSCVSCVLPILKKLKLPATFFLSSGFVNLSKKEASKFIRTRLFDNRSHPELAGGLTDAEVRKIVEEGFIVGGHTLNHSNLAQLADEDVLRYEIMEDKKRLEHFSGTKVDYFAYPFGAYHNPRINIVDILQQSGYKGAVTTLSGLNRLGSDRFMLNREQTPASIHGQLFKARAFGNYAAVCFVKQHLAKLI